MINYFNFKKLKDGDYLITNDMGCFMFVNENELESLIKDNVNYDSEFGIAAVENCFCYGGSPQAFSEHLMHYMRGGKQYLFFGTSLHIFVVTGKCNLGCVYCQAQNGDTVPHGTMSKKTAEKAVDIALSSPVDNLSFEFQGGEPLLNFETVKHIVEYALENGKGKNIQFSLVSNLTLLSDEIENFLIDKNISVSTSIDGPRDLHNANRPFRGGKGSFDETIRAAKKLICSGVNVGAIETTTRSSLGRAREIVDTYVRNGFSTVFIRPLTPLGTAEKNWGKIGYSSTQFLDFYKNAVNCILDYNRAGVRVKEGHLSLVLPKILNGTPVNYMELRSPCGAGIGQMAYYHDGNVYTCDEGRMLAEMGCDAFKLGNVFDNSYDELINCPNCKASCIASFLESLPSCCDCVYNPYCGTCPVLNFAQNNSIFPVEPNGFRCNVYKGIFDLAFGLIKDKNTFDIIKEWL